MGHLKVFIEFVTILFLFYVLVFWLWGTWDLSFLTRNWTFTLCVGRQSLNHWMAREVPSLGFNERLRVNVSESNPACPDLSLSSPTVWSSEKTTGCGIKASWMLGLKWIRPRTYLGSPSLPYNLPKKKHLASLEAGTPLKGFCNVPTPSPSWGSPAW